MKKAKIVLSAVAVFAVVGGAFAFKAQRFGFANLYTSTGVTTIGSATYPLCGNPSYVTTAPAATLTRRSFFSGKTVVANVPNICTLPTSTYYTTVAPE
jgi:hypothetical protein